MDMDMDMLAALQHSFATEIAQVFRSASAPAERVASKPSAEVRKKIPPHRRWWDKRVAASRKNAHRANVADSKKRKMKEPTSGSRASALGKEGVDVRAYGRSFQDAKGVSHRYPGDKRKVRKLDLIP